MEPLTPEEALAREVHEAERVEHYLVWRQACLTQGGLIYSNTSMSSGRCLGRKTCVPHRRDWDFRYEKDVRQGALWRAKPGNRVSCVSRDDFF